ncbi:uncharacterized protein LOC135831225 isoform X3 [Planococcus citri]
MARAGMTRWRSRNCAPVTDGCDEVQRSLDLLDRVLSEFDDFEGPDNSGADRSQTSGVEEEVTSLKSCSTPEDESPSGFGGHQSEDDGYMSMNGRKAKLMLTASSSKEFVAETNGNQNVTTPGTPPPLFARNVNKSRNQKVGDFPPPPEEAERIISTLLPRVSPCSSTQRNQKLNNRDVLDCVAFSLEENGRLDQYGRRVTTATQTTLPKTKHQRPYGWQKETANQIPYHNAPATAAAINGVSNTKTCSKYGSLPYDGAFYHDSYPPPWLQRYGGGQVPPRTVPTVLDRHREVRRCTVDSDESVLNTVQETVDEDPANFSDDSLEDVPPPPPSPPSASSLQPQNKRGSIAWEVSLESDNDAAVLIPGSTKVVGKRHRKSIDHSSTGSLNALNIYDDWPEPPNGTDDSLNCLTSDTDLDSVTNETFLTPADVSKKSNFNGGTYVIRRGNRRDRIQLSEMKTPTEKHPSNTPSSYMNGETDLKRCSSTFDNIKTLLKEGLVEGLDDSPPDFHPPRPPVLGRGVSLPNILNDSIYEDETKTSFITKDANESISSMEQLLENSANTRKTTTVSTGTNSIAVGVAESTDNLVEKSVCTEDTSGVDNYVEKQSVAVQVSADFSQLNKEIAEQSISCQTDNEELNYCVHKAVNTAENITSTSTFKREKKPAPKNEYHQTNGSLEEKESKIDSSIEDLLNYEKIDKKRELKLEIAKQETIRDSWNSISAIPEVHKVRVNENTSRPSKNLCNGISEKPCGDFRVNVEILPHEFGPLPPSPVEEVEDEYSDILQSVPVNRKSDSLNNDSVYRRSSRASVSGSIRSNRAPEIPPHREQTSSLKTRSVDAGFTRNHRTQFLGSRKEVPVERRTLPTDLPGTSYRRPFQKRGSQSPKDENAHVSCSLPETPIFARGCDIPRTPLRSTTDKANTSRPASRLNGIQTSGHGRNVGAGHGTCLGDAMAGAELLRLTGPGRGWYPRHRQPRPASVEHLDRLTPQGLSPSAPTTGAWDTRDARKPLTLPPNLSPKFFQRSPREALRRVTSLLIRKGGNSKDTKAKDVLASSVIGPHGDFGETSRQQKRGFFRSFWKRSRHYSLDQQ